MTTTTINRCVASLLQTVARFFKGARGPKCPDCSSVLIDDTCPNLDCPLKVAEWLVRWSSPEGVDIPALGQLEAAQLAGLRLVLHPGELYELGPGDWERLEGVLEVLGTSRGRPEEPFLGILARPRSRSRFGTHSRTIWEPFWSPSWTAKTT